MFILVLCALDLVLFAGIAMAWVGDASARPFRCAGPRQAPAGHEPGRAQAPPPLPAVEAAAWLDEAGLLADSSIRPGLPLRRLLREHRILGQRQEANRRWYIDRVRG